MSGRYLIQYLYKVHLTHNKQNNNRTLNEIDNYEISINPETEIIKLQVLQNGVLE